MRKSWRKPKMMLLDKRRRGDLYALLNISPIGEFVLMQLALTMMVRPHSKKRESWGMAAVNSMRRIIGDDSDAWYHFAAICFKMMSAPLEERRWYFDMGMDILHDVGCVMFPEYDDGERYTEYEISVG